MSIGGCFYKYKLFLYIPHKNSFRAYFRSMLVVFTSFFLLVFAMNHCLKAKLSLHYFCVSLIIVPNFKPIFFHWTFLALFLRKFDKAINSKKP